VKSEPITLAFVYVKNGDPQSALPEFEAYLKADPENAIAKKFVADIRSGKTSHHVIRQEATESRQSKDAGPYFRESWFAVGRSLRDSVGLIGGDT
jgi:hypothetical protein